MFFPLLVLIFGLIVRSQSDIYVCHNVSCSDLTTAIQSLNNSNELTVFIEPGEYELLSVARIHNANHIRIIASQESKLVCKQNGSGLVFEHCHNVTISGLKFVGCGQELVSANHDYFSSKLLKFNVTLYFVLSAFVTLDNLHINQSHGIAVQMYGVTGHNAVMNCVFGNNGIEYERGGGLYIEFPICIPKENSQCINTTGNEISNSFYSIYQNQFVSNRAMYRIIKRPSYLVPVGRNHNAFGKGGGLSVFFKGHASRNTIQLERNSFYSNSATFGAGLLIEFQDSASDNNVVIMNTYFCQNEAISDDGDDDGGGGGGGAYISFQNQLQSGPANVTRNTINFTNCTFTDNKAFYGGGVAFGTTKELNNLHYSTNDLSFSNCVWDSNVAQIGAGIDLLLYIFVNDIGKGIIPIVSLSDCFFTNNSIDYQKNVHGIGVIHSSNIPLQISGSINFFKNTGSSIVIKSTKVIFNPFTKATFIDNTARNGGGIYIIDSSSSIIMLNENSTFEFINNSVTNEGGAIYAFNPDGRSLLPHYGGNCFFQYHDATIPPDDWTVQFNFSNNRADNEKSSIYATSIISCKFSTDINLTDIFCWNGWNYINSSCKDEIKTGTANISSKHNKVNFIPGNSKSLGILALDELGNDVTKSLILTSSSSQVRIDNNYKYTSTDSIILYQDDYSNGQLTLQSNGPPVMELILNVSFRECPPGKNLVDGSCECPPFNQSSYFHCNNHGVQIQRGSWLGKYKDKLVVGVCRFCSYNQSGVNIDLKDDFTKINEELCGLANRSGVLCSECKPGNAVAVNSRDYVCVECSSKEGKYNWIFYLLLKVLTPLIIFIVIYILNIPITSGLWNGPIFFAQVLSTVIPLDGHDIIPNKEILGETLEQTLESLYLSVYSIWNIDIPGDIFPRFCLHQDITLMQLLVMEYAFSYLPFVFVLIMLIVYFKDYCRCNKFGIRLKDIKCCSCLKYLFNPQKTRNALVACIVLSYTKISVITSALTSTTTLYEVNDNKSHTVFYLNGNSSFTEISASYSFLPLLISLFVLLVFPLGLIILRHDKPSYGGFVNHVLFDFQSPFKSVIHENNNMKEKNICCQDKFKYDFEVDKENKSLKCKIGFCRGICGCLSVWSINDYRWMAGAYLLLRLTYVIIYTIIPGYFVQYLLHLILSISTAMFFLIFQPYKNDLHNKIDGFFFSILAIVISLSMQQYFLVTIAQKPDLGVYIIQYIFVTFAAIWMVGVIIYEKRDWFKKLLSCCQKYKNREIRMKEFAASENNHEVSEDNPLIHKPVNG